jgi:hypothetical protein
VKIVFDSPILLRVNSTTNIERGKKQMAKKIFYILTTILFLASAVLAQTASFTFQGKLNDGGIAANGTYQFQFKLFDANGVQVGQTLSDIPATVTNGIFAANLDFGANSFDGAARFIEIGVRQNGSAQPYTILNPRQAITATPYAVKSLKSEQATVADNSLNLGGIAANQYVQTIDSRLSDDRNPLPNSPNYIQNGTSQQALSNFNVSGEGKANVLSANLQFNIGGARVFHLSGNFNTFVGFETGNALTSGTFNAIFGTSGGRMLTTGTNNSFFGSLAGRDNSTGNDNSFFGQAAGLKNTNGAGNSFFGYGAGVDITGGARNTFVGYLTGQGNTNETDNTFIGYKANGAAGITNATAIGANAFVTQSNSLVLGTNLVTVQVPGNLTIANTFSANALDSGTVYKIGGARVFHLTGTDNTFVGSESGNSITTGGFNAFFGKESGKNNTTGLNNAFFGAYAGRDNIAGTNNAFFGANAGLSNKSSFNAFFGSGAGLSNINGTNNSYFGNLAGTNNSTGGDNSFFGSNAGKQTDNSSFNSFFGSFTGEKTTTGAGNTFVGALAGRENTIGFNNTFIGYKAGQTPTTGDNNVLIGYNASVANGVSNSVAIGANALVTQSNRTVISSQIIDLQGRVRLSVLSNPGSDDPVCRNSDYELTFCTSSLRYKESVQNFTRGLELIKLLRPVTFNWKEGGKKDVGFIAEEVNAAEPLLSTLDKDGQVEGVRYAQITTILVNSVKEQQTQIETQMAEIQKLREQLKQQQSQIEALKALVCAQNPSAAICQPGKDK